MGGTTRTNGQVNKTGEVFTPSTLAQEMVEQFPEEFVKELVFRDTSCGDGQLLSEILIRKVELGVPFEQALTQIQGCDIMSVNVELCRKRLACGSPKYMEILHKHIVVGNSLDCLADVDSQTEQDKLQMIEMFGGDFEALVEKVKTK
jgi:hypothetical protein